MLPARTTRFLAAFLGQVLLSVVVPRTLFHTCEHLDTVTAHDQATVQADTHCAICDVVISAGEGAPSLTVGRPVMVPVEDDAPEVTTLSVRPVERQEARGPPVLA